MAKTHSPAATAPASAPGFKGNKSALPSKPCLQCGREMTWRKAWAKNWEQVRYCSDACRKSRKATHAATR